MSESEIEKILTMIEKLQALKEAKEEHDAYRQKHSKAYLGFSPDHIEKALWSEVQQRVEEIEIDLAVLWDCICQNTLQEDNFGGWIAPTGTFRQNISCDIKYAIDSKNPADTNALVQHFKRIHQRLEVKPLPDKKPAATKRNTTPAKHQKIKKIISWIFKETWHLVVTIIGAIIVGIIVTVVTDILADFGLVERIRNILTRK